MGAPDPCPGTASSLRFPRDFGTGMNRGGTAPSRHGGTHEYAPSMAEERHSRQRMEVAMVTEIFAQKRVTSHVIDHMKNYEMSEERTERDLMTLYYQKFCPAGITQKEHHNFEP